MLKLRDYQQEAVAEHFRWFQLEDGHPLIVVPTGGGKSLIISEFIRESMENWPETRIVVATHVKELIQQNYDEFVDHWRASTKEPCPAGIYSAGLKRREHDAEVLFAGIQSIYNKTHLLGRVDLLLVDEAHLIPKSGNGRYRQLITDLTLINPALRVIGYTATHYRLDGGYLDRGDDALFHKVIYEVPVMKLVNDGYLAPLSSKAVTHVVKTDGVSRTGGDFNAGELQEAAMKNWLQAVEEMVEVANAYDRHHWLIFATGIDHAEQIREWLEICHEVNTACVFGHTPADEREKIVKRFRKGKLKCLINVGVLTTGFNAPCCDMIALMRPTQSTGLYVQMLGRGMRTAKNKADCLVLDYGENIQRHGPIDMVSPSSPRGGGAGTGTPPVKTCPECREIVYIATKSCPECDYTWNDEDCEVPIQRSATTLPVMGGEPVCWDVDRVTYARWRKAMKPDSLRVNYVCGTRVVSEWVCFEHDGYARQQAERWWQRAAESFDPFDIPGSVGDALDRIRQGEVRDPKNVHVVRDGKYLAVKKRNYG